jgi:L-gulonate 5-dehydrogenase
VRRALTIAPGRLEIETGRPSPVAAPGEVVIAVESVGICGSDLHAWLGDHPYFEYPRVQGHEFGGRILSVGSPDDARSLQVGERVAVEPLVACGTCLPCRRGRGNCCVNLEVLGSHVDGALAEQIAVAAASCHRVRDLDPQLTALVEPMAIGLQAIARADLQAGDSVVIMGAGPIGLAILIGANDLGARALVVDRVPARLALARTLGADATVDVTTDDLAGSVRAWTAGDGPIAVFEATGVPSLLRSAVHLVAASGTIVVVGLSADDVSMPIIEFTRKELTVVGSRNNAGLFPAAVALVRRRRSELASLVSRTFAFEDAAAAMEFVLGDPTAVGKVLIEVGTA